MALQPVSSMPAPQSLFQAAVNRLTARLGSGLADTAATLSLLAQDAPARVQQELSLFWEEVEQEAARLDREANPAPPGAAHGFSATPAPFRSSGQEDPQEAIDDLRAQVARFARRLDGGAGAGAAGGSTSFAQGPGPQA